MNTKERVIEYLKDNRPYFNLLTTSYKKNRDTYLNDAPLFHEEIRKDYKDIIMFLIINEACKALAVDYMAVWDVLEGINLEVYIDV